jgi:hypothetical protein
MLPKLRIAPSWWPNAYAEADAKFSADGYGTK